MVDSQPNGPTRRTGPIIGGIAFLYVIYAVGLLTNTFGWWPESLLGWTVFLLAGPPIYFLAEALIERAFRAPKRDH